MATRASTRVRTRSAKAVEAEATENLLAAAKAKQSSGAAADSEQQQTEEGLPAQPGDAQADSKEDGKTGSEDTGTRKSTRRRGKKTYCVCQKEARGEMIQCEGCKDWYVLYSRQCTAHCLSPWVCLHPRFHFDCINLSTEDADKIRACFREAAGRQLLSSACVLLS